MHKLAEKIILERKIQILKCMVEYYIATNKPVSSQTLKENFNIKLSSATIRKILSELEKEEYIQKFHKTSGYKPDIKTYEFLNKYFVDSIFELIKKRQIFRKEYEFNISGISNEIINNLKLLNLISKNSGYTIKPNYNKSKIKCCFLGKIDSKKIILVIFTTSGIIDFKYINIEFDIDKDILEFFDKTVNQKLNENSLEEFNLKLLETLDDFEHHKTSMVKLIKNILEITKC